MPDTETSTPHPSAATDMPRIIMIVTRMTAEQGKWWEENYHKSGVYGTGGRAKTSACLPRGEVWDMVSSVRNATDLFHLAFLKNSEDLPFTDDTERLFAEAWTRIFKDTPLETCKHEAYIPGGLALHCALLSARFFVDEASKRHAEAVGDRLASQIIEAMLCPALNESGAVKQ